MWSGGSSLRRDEPAKATWFVPGGRIRKEEKVAEAFERITWSELKIRRTIKQARYIGTFEHVYSENRFGDSGFGTRYFVLAYELVVSGELDPTPDDHHSEKRWWTACELCDPDRSKNVHKNTLAYFEAKPPTLIETGTHSLRSENQYKVIADRRNSFNTLLWQSPALSLTAQAFLLNIVSDENRFIWSRLVCGGVAVVVAFATLQLFAKHRYQEQKAVEHLDEFERNHQHLGYVTISGRKHSGTDVECLDPEQREFIREFDGFIERLRRFPSTVLWLLLQIVFIAVAIGLMLIAFHQPRSTGKQDRIGHQPAETQQRQ